MSEAPKRIWFTPDEELASVGKLDDEDIPYIRADIVLELVEALQELLIQTRQYGHKPEIAMAEAALKKLEDV